MMAAAQELKFQKNEILGKNPQKSKAANHYYYDRAKGSPVS